MVIESSVIVISRAKSAMFCLHNFLTDRGWCRKGPMSFPKLGTWRISRQNGSSHNLEQELLMIKLFLNNIMLKRFIHNLCIKNQWILHNISLSFSPSFPLFSLEPSLLLGSSTEEGLLNFVTLPSRPVHLYGIPCTTMSHLHGTAHASPWYTFCVWEYFREHTWPCFSHQSRTRHTVLF